MEPGRYQTEVQLELGDVLSGDEPRLGWHIGGVACVLWEEDGDCGALPSAPGGLRLMVPYSPVRRGRDLADFE